MVALARHQAEIRENLDAWSDKPLLRRIYGGFYARIVERIDPAVEGPVVELGSGIGNLKQHAPDAICSDLFHNEWLDVVCDGYRLPFPDASLSHIVLFDVFHHLQRPQAFFREARRTLRPGGGVILFEPYMSLASLPVYGMLHPEPLGLRRPIDQSDLPPAQQTYYAAQGNATRCFFGRTAAPTGFTVAHAERFACFAYLLSGGYSRPAVYPERWLPMIDRFDRRVSRLPRVFGGRCLVDVRVTR